MTFPLIHKSTVSISPALTSVASSSTPTPVINSVGPLDYQITALGEAATFEAPSGVPSTGQVLMISIKDDGTPRSLDLTTCGAYLPINVTLPTITVSGKWLYIGCKYNSNISKWHVLAVGQES